MMAHIIADPIAAIVQGGKRILPSQTFVAHGPMHRYDPAVTHPNLQ